MYTTADVRKLEAQLDQLLHAAKKCVDGTTNLNRALEDLSAAIREAEDKS